MYIKKVFTTFLFLAIAGYLGYEYRDLLQHRLVRLENIYLPCKRPITYHIGSLDPKFGISREYVESVLRDAEAVWEKSTDRELFAYKSDGNVRINLIYDFRQQATVTLQKLGLEVADDQASYNKIKTKYDSLTASHNADNARLEKNISDFKTMQSTYKKEVAYWNSQQGAPKEEYDRLRNMEVELQKKANELNDLQARVNERVDTMNTLVVTLNGLVKTLNLQISDFNTIGSSRGSEYEEGTYKSDASGQRIDIYEFEDREKLVVTLVHELGHALGLEHIDDQNAIMYRLNTGSNTKLTRADIDALNNLCGSN